MDCFSWKGPTTITWSNCLTTSGLTKSSSAFVKGIDQTPLKHRQARGIDPLSSKPVRKQQTLILSRQKDAWTSSTQPHHVLIFLWQAGLILCFQVVKFPTSKLSVQINSCPPLPLAFALYTHWAPLATPAQPSPAPPPKRPLPQQPRSGTTDGTAPGSLSPHTHIRVFLFMLETFMKRRKGASSSFTLGNTK